MDEKYMNIVIIGHVDHGKSTLTGRLFYDTGCLPEEKLDEIRKTCERLGRDFEFAYAVDHLEEEREQEMTIDTAQAFFKTAKRRYVIIDTPGHKEFMKNMITGASQAETAILIVDASQGVEEQTKRHAYVLGMLGIGQVIVVINKMDLVDYSQDVFNQVSDSITRFLGTLKIKPSYVIPVSAKDGDNIAKPSNKIKWYNGKPVLECLDSFNPEKERTTEGLRFPVQDVYKIEDRDIIVGRIENGEIRKGDEVLILPDKIKTRIASIEVYTDKITQKEKAETGESIGLTVEDGRSINRGSVICTESNVPELADSFRANVFWMSAQPLDLKDRLKLKLSTEEAGAVVERLEKKIDSSSLEEIKDRMDRLGETEVGLVSIKTDKPVLMDKFNQIAELGRFVLVRNNDIVAGGIIV